MLANSKKLSSLQQRGESCTKISLPPILSYVLHIKASFLKKIL